MPVPRVHEEDAPKLAAADWRRSGLDDETAAKLGFTPLSSDETRSLGDSFQAVPSLFIPYFDMEGNRTDFFRVRYLQAPRGFAGIVEKPQRYAQAPGTLNEVYLPPLFDHTWATTALDASLPIFITEGEKKAACGSHYGFHCIGLGGVDVWRATKRGIDFLPALAEINWTGRNTCVVFDSDAASNPNVVRAQRQLAAALLERGAHVKILSLPAAPDGSKQGLDDYLKAKGGDDFMTLAAESPGFAESDALWKLSEEIVYIKNPGIIVEQESGIKISPNNFVAHVYANRHYVEEVAAKTGTVFKKKPLAKRWIEWESRYALDGITYQPGATRVHNKSWNVWKGWGVRPKAGDMAPWHWLLGFLFQDDPEAKVWFERWLAYPLQNPGAKLYTASVLWGAHQGTGKTLAAYAMMRLYGVNAVEIKNKDLRGNFNDWAEAKQFVYGDEITGGDKRVDADWLKGLITQDRMRVNIKYTPTFELPDCVNYLFTSNHPDAFFLEDDDRRFFVHEVSHPAAEPHFYKVCDAWLRGDGPSALFDYLLRLPMGDFEPHASAPVTTAKTAMMLDGKGDLAMWVSELRGDPSSALRVLGERAAGSCDLFTAQQLKYAYDKDGETRVTPNGVGRELKRAKFKLINRGEPIQCSAGRLRFYAIRNFEKWNKAPHAEVAAYFDSFFGGAAPKPAKF